MKIRGFYEEDDDEFYEEDNSPEYYDTYTHYNVENQYEETVLFDISIKIGKYKLTLLNLKK